MSISTQICPVDRATEQQLIFDPLTKKCDRAAKTPCRGRPFFCPMTNQDANYPNPNSCNSYYRCVNDVPYLLVSDNGSIIVFVWIWFFFLFCYWHFKNRIADCWCTMPIRVNATALATPSQRQHVPQHWRRLQSLINYHLWSCILSFQHFLISQGFCNFVDKFFLFIIISYIST